MRGFPLSIGVLAILCASIVTAPAQTKEPPHSWDGRSSRAHLADYDAEPRRPDGRVDIDGLMTRLKELGATTYYWLIWHAATDWDDLKLFLPRAAEANIEVWPYLVPPTESAPQYGTQYAEPFRLEYLRWAEEIAKLSREHPNLTAWVIDDFYANHDFYTPAYVRQMREKAHAINPKLAFLPLMYFGEMRPRFVADYREVIDGVVVAYLQDRDEIERVWAVLNDATLPWQAELAYPWNQSSRAGDFVRASQVADVLHADRAIIRFQERDDFSGPTAGYHFKQVLLDDAVVWEEDVAGEGTGKRTVTVDVSEKVRGKDQVALSFRLFDKKGVSNFGVRWELGELSVDGLRLPADPNDLTKWKVERRGEFETGFGTGVEPGQRRFHVPFISMTAGSADEFRLRHGDPASAERMAEQLQLSLTAWREGKCDGVVTYCLDKRRESEVFPLARKLFREFGAPRGSQ